MAKHSGCYICGSTDDEVLTSIPDLRTHTSVAICSKCYGLPTKALRDALDAVHELMTRTRRQSVNG